MTATRLSPGAHPATTEDRIPRLWPVGAAENSSPTDLFCAECRQHQQQRRGGGGGGGEAFQVSSATSSPSATSLRRSRGATRATAAAARAASCWSHFSSTTAVLCLLCLLISRSLATPLFTSTSATQQQHRQQQRTPKPKWVNPCGVNPGGVNRMAGSFGKHYEIRPLSDGELLENVILAAKNALRHSKVFKEDYVKKTFRAPTWWDHHETWKDMRYDWLPSWQEIPKHLHEKTSRDHLAQLKVDDSLRNIYTYLQKLAVGLEQVVLDQTLYDGLFMEEFNEAEFKLKAVLCEMQVAMLEKGIVQHAPTSRKIMSKDIRDIEDESYRNLRDWYIYRDYINGLEYVVHSFEHLKRSSRRRRR